MGQIVRATKLFCKIQVCIFDISWFPSVQCGTKTFLSLFFFRHFIVLIASSSSVEDQLEWVGLVESKIRHLILALERNDHITLAHINPEQYDPVQPEPYVFYTFFTFPNSLYNHFIGWFCRDTISTMWFIGLVFKKTESLNIDLTQDIQAFTAQGLTHT